MPMLIALVGAATLASLILFGDRLWTCVAERLDAPPNLEAVDLHRVHAELFPAWVIALSRPAQTERTREQYEALQQAVAPDGNLRALLTRLQEAVDADLTRNSERVVELVTDWNRYLDEHGAPYLLSPTIVIGDEPAFYATSLHTLVDLRVPVGDTRVRARIVERIDNTNIRERYLGVVRPGIDGAVVLSDRVLEFALDRIWPVLDGGEGPFSAALSREASEAMSAGALAVLVRTAHARREAVDAVTSINDRSDCSRFVVNSLPWSGLDARGLRSLERAVDGGTGCVAVRPAEFDAVSRSAQVLAGAAGLDDAVKELLAWVTRGVVLHEVRHVADAGEYGDEGATIECTICRERDTVAIRRELSAYAASIGWSRSPATTLFQACDAITNNGGTHEKALDRLMTAADLACEVPPPDDLAERVRAVEARAFDRHAPIELPANMPTTLPLPSRGVG